MTKSQIGLYIFFYVGAALHVLLRAGFAIRNPVNPIASRRAFVAKYWDTILIRAAMATAVFAFWLGHSTAINSILGYFNSPLKFDFDFPVTFTTSGVFGFFIDQPLDSLQSVIATVPQLAWLNVIIRGQIPVYGPVTTTVVKEMVTSTTTVVPVLLPVSVPPLSPLPMTTKEDTDGPGH